MTEEVADTKDTKLADVLEKLSGVISAKFTPAPAPAPVEEKTYTTAELNDAVLSGQLTQASADAIAQRQHDAHIAAAAAAAVQNHAAATSVSEEITKYKELVPNILVEGSTEHKRLATEYNRQISRGLPPTIATELVALEIVFGKAAALESAKNPKRNTEHHQDVGGGDEGDTKAKGPLAKIPVKHREYYQDQIRKGRYEGEDDPELLEELKYIKAA